jgi:hypothetical protein
MFETGEWHEDLGSTNAKAWELDGRLRRKGEALNKIIEERERGRRKFRVQRYPLRDNHWGMGEEEEEEGFLWDWGVNRPGRRGRKRRGGKKMEEERKWVYSVVYNGFLE